MSLVGALFTGVSGLKAQGSKIGMISDNIANVNTIGYKERQATFNTLVVNSSASKSYSPGGTIASMRAAIDRQGLLLATDAPTDLAISGSGFFVVNSDPNSNGSIYYTRAGSYRQDSLGNFVNAEGFFLQGWPLDREGRLPGEPGNSNTTSSANLDSLQTINVESASGVAIATSLIQFGANLNASQVVYPGSGATITMDALSINNRGMASDELIVSNEYGAATPNNISRGDRFTISTGSGLNYTYNYGGYTTGRSVTTSGSAGFGDGGNSLAANALATGAITVPDMSNVFTVTTPAAHGLQNGDVVRLSGFAFASGSNVPLTEVNTDHVVTVTGPNSYTFTTATSNTSGADSNVAAMTWTTRLFDGNILNATSASQKFLSTTQSASFNAAELSFTVSSGPTGPVTFKYVDTSPNATLGQFNNLNNLAEAIDTVAGLTARVVGGRLYVGAEDASEAVTFSNGAAVSLSSQDGIDWVSELDMVNIAAGTNRFNSIGGLATLVNASDGLRATLTNPLSDANITINVSDPQDTITLADYQSTPVTLAPGNISVPATAGGPGATDTVTITSIGHGLQTGDTITLTSLGAIDYYTAGELTGTFTVTMLDADTYTIQASHIADGSASAGATNAVSASFTATNTGSLLAELGLVPSLQGGAYSPQTTGALGPAYDPTGSGGDNMASGDIVAQFSRNIRVYDSLGSGHDVRISLIKIATNTWAAEVHVIPATEVSSSLPDGQIATGTISFNGDGSLSSLSSSLTNAIPVNWSNGAEASSVTVDWGTAGAPFGTVGALSIGGTNGLSQFDSNYNFRFGTQNGAPAGELVSISISPEGILTASYSNGDTQDLFQLPIADFANPNGLRLNTGNVFQQTRESGDVNLRESGEAGTGEFVSGALESSNVELSEQLTDMIVAQRAYQSSTKVISTVDELLEELNRI